jgi:hypothetical protein
LDGSFQHFLYKIASDHQALVISRLSDLGATASSAGIWSDLIDEFENDSPIEEE